MTDPGRAEPLEVFPIAFGVYRNHDDLDVDGEVKKVAESLHEFGGRLVDWDTPMIERDQAAADERINEWADSSTGNTIFYWVGHGWSNHDEATLGHAASPDPIELEGVRPDLIAYRINRREHTNPDPRCWTIVVVDACKSARFVEKVSEAVDRLGGPRRLLLVGASGVGSTTLGQFSSALRRALTDTFAAEREISLWELGGELKRRLPDHSAVVPKNVAELVLHRRVPLPAGATLDIAPKIQAALTQLSPDEQRHFIPKAQGGELGEVTWYFEGRAEERTAITSWLRRNDSGMLVITGRAGSGKSALLGNLLVHSRPQLRRTLVEFELIGAVPEKERPEDNVFDSTIHLTGLSSVDLCRRLSADLGIGLAAADAPLTAQIDRLLDGVLASPAGRMTVLVDALDEAVDPITMGRAVLRPLAAISGFRVVVGTRRSTREGPDEAEPHEHDILEALDVAEEHTVAVSRDAASITKYVHKRLAEAKRADIPGEAITTASWAIGNSGREFLFARLAVHELLARPDLLGPQGLGDLASLIAGDHRGLFARAVERLEARRPANRYLLQALAFARGRGVPMRDGVWCCIAEAVAGGSGRNYLQITNDDASALRDDAAPYLAVDIEHGQTIYRLAHRTFAEYFTFEHEAAVDDTVRQLDRQRHLLVTRRLIDAVEEAGEDLNPYLASYLSAHAAAGGRDAWQALEDRPDTLDHLEPRAVTTDAMRSAFGRFPLPPQIAGTISAAQQLGTASAEDRRGRRQLAAFRHGAVSRPSGTGRGWSVPWAELTTQATHMLLTGHHGPVTAMAMLFGPDDGVVLATGDGQDGTVRLWDPVAGFAIGEPLGGHIGGVRAMAGYAGENSLPLLATGGQDGTVRRWDPASGTAIGEPLTGHVGPVHAVAAFEDERGRTVVASGGRDRVVWFWDPVRGEALGGPLSCQVGPVCSLAIVESGGRTLLAVAGTYGSVRIYDVATREQYGGPLRSYVDGRQELAVYVDEGDAIRLAVAGQDGRIRLWDRESGRVVGCLTAEYRTVAPLVVLRAGDGRPLLTGGAGRGTVLLWDPVEGRTLGEPLAGHPGVRSATTFGGRHGQQFLVTGSQDGSVRIWAPATDAPSAPDEDPPTSRSPQRAHRRPVDAVATIAHDGYDPLLVVGRGSAVGLFAPGRSGWSDRWYNAVRYNVKAIAGFMAADGTPILVINDLAAVELLDMTTGDRLARCPLFNGDSLEMTSVTAVTTLVRENRSILVLCGLGNGEIACWNVLSGEFTRFPAHVRSVRSLAVFELPDGHIGLVSGGADGRLVIWNVETGARWRYVSAIRRGVRSVVITEGAGGRRLLAALDEGNTMRLWDMTKARQPVELGDGLPRIDAIADLPSSDGGQLLVTADGDGEISLWEPGSARVIRKIGLGARALTVAALGTRLLAVGMRDGVAVIEL
ncbi:hypothetical protein ACPZ19_50840 [Amycolatopsis lurida]